MLCPSKSAWPLPLQLLNLFKNTLFPSHLTLSPLDHLILFSWPFLSAPPLFYNFHCVAMLLCVVLLLHIFTFYSLFCNCSALFATPLLHLKVLYKLHAMLCYWQLTRQYLHSSKNTSTPKWHHWCSVLMHFFLIPLKPSFVQGWLFLWYFCVTQRPLKPTRNLIWHIRTVRKGTYPTLYSKLLHTYME